MLVRSGGPTVDAARGVAVGGSFFRFWCVLVVVVVVVLLLLFGGGGGGDLRGSSLLPPLWSMWRDVENLWYFATCDFVIVGEDPINSAGTRELYIRQEHTRSCNLDYQTCALDACS